jgi:hypothetical protein
MRSAQGLVVTQPVSPASPEKASPMSKSLRAHALSAETFVDRHDEQSGVRRIGGADLDAQRLWDEANLRDEAAELAMFEWHMFLTELAPPPAEAPSAPEALAAPEAPAAVIAPVPRRHAVDPLAPSPDEVRAWQDGAPRRARIRALGRALFAGAFLGMLGIAATPAGSDAIASFVTMGHRAEMRAQVALLEHRVVALAR